MDLIARPRIEIPDGILEDLRARIDATRGQIRLLAGPGNRAPETQTPGIPELSMGIVGVEPVAKTARIDLPAAEVARQIIRTASSNY